MLVCGVGAKSVAHLMKIHLLQSKVVQVKFLMNSKKTLGESFLINWFSKVFGP